MNRPPTFGLVMGVLLASLVAWCGRAQSVQHLTITQPGGLPGAPVMTGINPVTNGVVVTWDGPSGYYQLFRKPIVAGAKWLPVGLPTNLVRRATVSNGQSNSVFQVGGPSPNYGGAQLCGACHGNIYKTEVKTPHAQAFQTLKTAHQDKNPSCLPCHTVGYGLTTGFISESATPQLAGAQCENCHGPEANHAANETDPTVRPRIEIAATVCGGCHTGPQQPTFEEWKSSGHAEVVEDMNPTNRIDSCGRCHSGSARLSLLQGRALPFGDANIGIVCITCHDPHQTNAYPAQLRNPLFSTNDYFITTSGVFTNQYNPKINLCAQCHNHRGASWTSSSREPHHSPQYNMLLGTVGELVSGLPHYEPASHALLITNQCADCHMQNSTYQGTNQPAVTGHSFKVQSYQICARCHVDANNAQNLAAFVQQSVSNQIQEVKAALDLWAATKAPPALWTKYGTLAWEYSTPGELSSGTAGPNSTEQTQIPVNIQKARFNMYIVNNEGSFGVHNAPYVATLLENASNWVQAELNQ